MNKLSIRSIIPNVTTLIGLCFGIIAICFALSGQFKLSVICIMMASICDVLDGRLSRLLKSESKLGAELDSLADFLNFGIAPSILIYISLLQNAGLIERVAVLFKFRRLKVGSILIKNIIKHYMNMDDNKSIILHSQVAVADFYKTLNFISNGNEFFEDGISHIAMKYVKSKKTFLMENIYEK